MNTILNDIVTEALPLLLQGLSALVMLMLMRASSYAKARWGIEIEEGHRKALHSAAMSGIRAALARGLSGKPAMDAAVAHMLASTPDAIAALRPASGVLTSIAEAKLREVLEASPLFMLDARAGADTKAMSGGR